MSESSDPYSLGRKSSESQRLKEQHGLSLRTWGFLLHPHIPTSTTLKIADIATGTGIWLLDLADTLSPSCQLVGYDISAAQFPRQSTWPSNVLFKIHSMLEPFPEAQRGTYDIVAIRYVTLAITTVEWEASIKNVITLLRLGGWIQWIDSDTLRFYQSKPGTSVAAIKDVKLVETLRELGFKDIWEDCFAGDKVTEDRERKTKNGLGAMESILGRLASVEGSRWTVEKRDRILEDATTEAEGAYFVLDQFCVVGRKP